MSSHRLIRPLVGATTCSLVLFGVIGTGAALAHGNLAEPSPKIVRVERSSDNRNAEPKEAQAEARVIVRATPSASVGGGGGGVTIQRDGHATAGGKHRSVTIQGGADANGQPVEVELQSWVDAQGQEHATLKINGQKIDVASHQEAMDVLRERGISTPTFNFDIEVPDHPMPVGPMFGSGNHVFEMHSGSGGDRHSNNMFAPSAAATGPSKAMLGVLLASPSDDLRNYLGLDEETGALVSSVVPDSPAAAAGLQPNDLIVAVTLKTEGGERQGVNAQSLRELIGGSEPDTKITLHVLRGGQPKDLEARLGAPQLQQMIQVMPAPAAPPSSDVRPPRVRFEFNDELLRNLMPQIDHEELLKSLESLEDVQILLEDRLLDLKHLLPEGLDLDGSLRLEFGEGNVLEVLPEAAPTPPAPPAGVLRPALPTPPMAPRAAQRPGDPLASQIEDMRRELDAQMRRMEEMMRRLESLQQQQMQMQKKQAPASSGGSSAPDA